MVGASGADGVRGDAAVAQPHHQGLSGALPGQQPPQAAAHRLHRPGQGVGACGAVVAQVQGEIGAPGLAQGLLPLLGQNAHLGDAEPRHLLLPGLHPGHPAAALQRPGFQGQVGPYLGH